MATKEEIIKALRDEIGEWEEATPDYVMVSGRFLRDVLRLLEEDDG